MKEVQEVDVYVQMAGDYCAFHEVSIYVVYDITNDIALGDMTLEELEKWDYEGDYSDYGVCDAVLIDGEYYIKF